MSRSPDPVFKNPRKEGGHDSSNNGQSDSKSDGNTDTGFLANKFLIATPAMRDPRFLRSVIYLCAHDNEEAMGLIINQSYQGLSLAGLLDGLDLPGLPSALDGPVIKGGPVEQERGFVLHPKDYYDSPTTLDISSSLSLTTSRDILIQITTKKPPAFLRMALGYAGWGAGQLEEELMQNAWLVADSNDALIFDTPLDLIWNKALESLGVKAEMLSSLGGHA